MASATGVLSIWDKVSSWMGGMDAAIDALMRPLVSPLADMFDWLTGDSEAVRTTAERWRVLSHKVEALIAFHEQVVRTMPAGWQGPAADAYLRSMRDLLKGLEEMSRELGDTAEFLDDAAMEVEAAEQLVETIIRELIEWALLSLAVSAALAIVTLGASAVAGAGAAAAQAAVAGTRIARVLTQVASALQRFAQLMQTIKAMSIFTTEGFLIKQLLVKGVILRPVVSNLTGITASPISEGGKSLLQSGRDILADEFDDRRSGGDRVQTPLRDVVDDFVHPVADVLDPVLDKVEPLLDPLIELGEKVPERPFS
jgi:WXG100 family type VII secretion target